jgi:hypothetical protein
VADKKQGTEAVKAREFDLTKFAKRYGGAVGILFPAIIGALDKVKGIHITTPIVVAALGVTAAALLGIAFVSAVDIAARAFLSGEGSAQKSDGGDDGEAHDEAAAAPEVIAAPTGMQVWLKEGDSPHPVAAMSSDGKKVTSYLVATGSSQERTVDGKQVKAIDGTVKWCDAAEVQAIRADGWP